MARIPRAVALVPGLIALQLSLLGGGSGFVCPMAGHDGSLRPDIAGSSAASVAEMEMPAQSATSLGGDSSSPDETPCDHPTTTQSCQTMAPCGPVLVLAAEESSGMMPPVTSRVIDARVLTPPSQSTPPELPPPRA
ncbi:MAG: hypothetical protein ACRENI_11005 [Gemmatimonadaceae bacterium]